MARRKADILWAVAALVWAVVGLALWIWWTIEARWDAMLGKIERYREESQVQRPPWGEPEPGDAWEAYLPAMQGVWKGKGPTGHLESLARLDEPWYEGEMEDVVALLDENRQAMESFRQGSCRAPGASPPEMSNLYRSAVALGQLAQIDFLLSLREGRPERALNTLLALIKYAWGLGWTPDVDRLDQAGLLLLEDGMVAAALLVESGSLDSAESLRLASSLAAVDVSFPRMKPGRMYDLSRMAAVLRGVESLGGCGAGASWYSRNPGWRQLWSWKVKKAAAFDDVASLVRRLADTDQMPWAEARGIEEEVRQDLRRTKGSFTPDELEASVGLQEDLRWRRQRLLVRIVRMAAHYQGTGRVLLLEDPGEGWVDVQSAEGETSFGTTCALSLGCVERGAPRKFVVRVRR